DRIRVPCHAHLIPLGRAPCRLSPHATPHVRCPRDLAAFLPIVVVAVAGVDELLGRGRFPEPLFSFASVLLLPALSFLSIFGLTLSRGVFRTEDREAQRRQNGRSPFQYAGNVLPVARGARDSFCGFANGVECRRESGDGLR